MFKSRNIVHASFRSFRQGSIVKRCYDTNAVCIYDFLLNLFAYFSATVLATFQFLFILNKTFFVYIQLIIFLHEIFIKNIIDESTINLKMTSENNEYLYFWKYNFSIILTVSYFLFLYYCSGINNLMLL